MNRTWLYFWIISGTSCRISLRVTNIWCQQISYLSFWIRALGVCLDYLTENLIKFMHQILWCICGYKVIRSLVLRRCSHANILKMEVLFWTFSALLSYILHKHTHTHTCLILGLLLRTYFLKMNKLLIWQHKAIVKAPCAYVFVYFSITMLYRTQTGRNNTTLHELFTLSSTEYPAVATLSDV